MRNKYVQLIVLLQEANSHISGKELANRLGVSSRTIRNYVKDLNENYLIDAEIVNYSNKGYTLEGTITNVKQFQQYEYEERIFLIIKILMEANDWITYEEIGNRMFFSQQTVRNDIIKLNKQMEQRYRRIKIETARFKGIRLEGDEIDKRLYLDSLANPATLNKNNYIKLLSNYFKGWISPYKLSELITFLREMVEKLEIPTDINNLLPIISYLIISVKRIENGYVISEDIKQFENYNINKTKEYKIAQSLLDFMLGSEDKNVPELESVFLGMYLISERLLYNPSHISDHYVPTVIKDSVVHVLKEMSIEYDTDFLSDTQLTSGLILHLSKDILPLVFNFQIENSFIKTIKKEFIEAYYIAISFVQLISTELGLLIPENEIGYIALHFASSIERKNERKVRAVFVNGRSLPASEMLLKTIKGNIEGIEIIQVVEFDHLKNINEKYEVVISPLLLSRVSDIPAFQINEFPTSEEILNLQNFINLILSNATFNIEYFDHLTMHDKTEILQTLLFNMDLEEMYESVLERENISSTEIGRGVAIPHPLKPSNKTSMSIGIAVLKDKIKWGSELIDVVILMIPGTEDKNTISKLMSQIFHKVNDKKVLAKIKSAQSIEEINKLFKDRRNENENHRFIK